MLTKQAVRGQIERHLEGGLSREDLSVWAERVLRDEDFEPAYTEQIEAVLSALRDATDPHRFRWEEPDLDRLLDLLED